MHPLPLPHSRTYTHTRTHTQTRTYVHTHTYTLTHGHVDRQIHTHTCFRSISLSLVECGEQARAGGRDVSLALDGRRCCRGGERERERERKREREIERNITRERGRWMSLLPRSVPPPPWVQDCGLVVKSLRVVSEAKTHVGWLLPHFPISHNLTPPDTLQTS